MLLVLMYHQIAHPNMPQSSKLFKQHLLYLRDNFSIILPGEKLHPEKTSICLTFDDAYFDFYHVVYPLLQQYKIKAILGIPTQWIQENSPHQAEKRLSVPYPQGLQKQWQATHSPLCTWHEIRKMVSSNLVYPASHSHSHANFTNPSTQIQYELQTSRDILQDQLNKNIDTFIYPFGNLNRNAHKIVSQYYSYNMRIGTAINRTWHDLIYRIDATELWQSHKIITAKSMCKYIWKYWVNKLRNK